MPQRLPLVVLLGALSLLASALPSYADVTPVHRPPAVPPLPLQAQQPPAQDQPADPIALKRDAQTQDISDIALSSLGRAIDFGQPAPAQIALGEASQEAAKPAEQTDANASPAQPAQDAPSTSAAQSHGDLASFLPDIDLKSISQDPGLGYHATIAPFSADEAVAEAAPSSEKSATLPDVTPNLKVTVAFNYSEPLSLLIMPADEELTGAQQAQRELPPTKPRKRPLDLIASNDDHAGEARPLTAKGEPVFELRR